MVYFTPAIDRYCASWILPETWYTGGQDDQDRFYRFVLAVNLYSRPVRNRHVADDAVKPARSIHNRGLLRNPRTYDQQAMKRKIILAVRRNHTFNEGELEKYAVEFAREAIKTLDCLWVAKTGPIGDIVTRKWEPPLK